MKKNKTGNSSQKFKRKMISFTERMDAHILKAMKRHGYEDYNTAINKLIMSGIVRNNHLMSISKVQKELKKKLGKRKKGELSSAELWGVA